MISCPNCGILLAFSLSHCPWGRCPRCGYKPGDFDKDVRADRKLVRKLREFEKSCRTLGFSDTQIDVILAEWKAEHGFTDT
jgi:hypothetical protein